MHPHDFVDPDIAHEVTHDEYEIRCDDTPRVDIAHGISGGERLFRRDDRNNFESEGWFGPF